MVLAVCSHASRGDSPTYKELKSEAVTVTKTTAVTGARAMGEGEGGREKVIPNERSGRLHNKACCTQSLRAVQEFILVLSQRW